MSEILKISTELVKTILPDVPIFEDSCFWVAPHKSSIGMDRYYLVSGYNDPSRTARTIGNFDTFLRLMDEYFEKKGWIVQVTLEGSCDNRIRVSKHISDVFYLIDYGNSFVKTHLAAGEFMNKNNVR